MIGIFDSGVGGLSIYREIKKSFNGVQLVYLADKKNFPYGEKTDQELKELAKTNVEILIKHGAKIIVVACNSATVSVINDLRSMFTIPIVGIEPAIKQAALASKTNKIGLIATTKTVSSHQNEKMLKPGQILIKTHNGELVSKIENDYTSIKDAYLKDSIEELAKEGVDSVALGCTHYHFVKERLETIFPEITFYAPDTAVAKRVVDIARENEIELTAGEDIFLVTDGLESFIISLNDLLGEKTRDVRRI